MIKFKKDFDGKYIGTYSEYPMVNNKPPIHFTVTIYKDGKCYCYKIQDNNSDFHIIEYEGGNNLAEACFEAGFRLDSILNHYRYRS